MELVVDVGNTEGVVGVFDQDSLTVRATWRYTTTVPRTPDEFRSLLRGFLAEAGIGNDAIRRIVLGSVVPAQTETLRRGLAFLGGAHLVVLDGAEDLPIRLDVEEPRTVGADRIANTLAASHLFRSDTIVVDLGTATTFDCVGADGVFYGGVIAPGIQAGQEWLGGRTAKLPRVELVRPARVIGRRTESCLQSGLFYSAVDAVDGLVDRIREEWARPEAIVVATGGHARILPGHSRTVDRIEPHLTLIGLALAGRYRTSAAQSG